MFPAEAVTEYFTHKLKNTPPHAKKLSYPNYFELKVTS